MVFKLGSRESEFMYVYQSRNKVWTWTVFYECAQKAGWISRLSFSPAIPAKILEWDSRIHQSYYYNSQEYNAA